MSLRQSFTRWLNGQEERRTLDQPREEPLPSGVADAKSTFWPKDDPAMSLGNPMYNLTPIQAATMFEQYMRGEYTRIQWLFEWISKLDADIISLNDRRMTALAQLPWTVRINSDIPDEQKALAGEQKAALDEHYSAQDDLSNVIGHLASAVFRGYAHVYKRRDGSLETLDQWWFIRRGLFGDWYYNPDAKETSAQAMSDDAKLDPARWIVWERPNNLLFLAVLKYLRCIWNERWWDKFAEAVSKQGVVIVAPERMSLHQIPAFKADAIAIAKGGSGILPGGSTVNWSNGSRGPIPFQTRLQYLRESIVLAGTGGQLTSLTAATGIGSGAADVQENVFQALARADARQISQLFNRTLDRPILAARFPGQPILAYYELGEVDDIKTPAEVLQDAANARTAGYQISREQLEELTGYKLELAPAAPFGNAKPGSSSAPPLAVENAASAKPLAAQPPTQLPEAWAAAIAAAVNAWLQKADDGAPVEELHNDLAAMAEQVLSDNTAQDALAQQLQTAMTDAAAAIANDPDFEGYQSNSEYTISNAVEIGPLKAAVEKILGKTITPSAMSSAEWEQLSTDIRDRAFFSSRVESAHLLQRLRNRIADALQLRKNDLDAGMDRSAFIRELRDELAADGYDVAQGSQDLRDITSQRRLGLIYDMNTTNAAEAARYQMHQDPDVLEAFPVRELLRVESRMVPRDWQSRWVAAGGKLYAGRMIAPINDPIWTRISRFGTPYPPFDYASGMGVLDLPRSEAEQVGALPEEQQTPQPADMNRDLSASAAGLDVEALKALQKALGGNYGISDGRIRRLP